MKYQEYNINQAKGVHLAEAVRFDGLILEKGHPLTDDDIMQFKLSGIKRVLGAEMGQNDLDYKTALNIIAAKLCGANTAFALNQDGICRIVADGDGLFKVADERIAKFNRLSSELILNTIPPYTKVKKGELLAELDLTVPVITSERTDEFVFSLSGNVPLLQVHEVPQQTASLVYSKF